MITLKQLELYARKGYRITITDKFITLENRKTKEQTSFSVYEKETEEYLHKLMGENENA